MFKRLGLLLLYIRTDPLPIDMVHENIFDPCLMVLDIALYVHLFTADAMSFSPVLYDKIRFGLMICMCMIGQ